MIVALHIHDVKVGKSVAVQVAESRVSVPESITQIHFP